MIANFMKAIVPLAVALACAGPAAAEDDPQAFVESLYETGWEKISADPGTRREMLTGAFAKVAAGHGRLAAQDQVGYDPLTGGDAGDVMEIVAEITEESDDSATAHVTFRGGSMDGAVDMVLDKSPKGLRLDDIVLPDGASVRGDMGKALQTARAGKDAGKATGEAPAGKSDKQKDNKKAGKSKKDKQNKGMDG